MKETGLPGSVQFFGARESCVAFDWFYTMRRVSGVELASEAILRISFSSLSSPRAESLHGAGFFVASWIAAPPLSCGTRPAARQYAI